MQKRGDRIVFSPTDLNHFLACEYLTRLDLEAAHGRPVERVRSAEAELLAEKGEAHERRHLARLASEGLRVTDIPDPGDGADWAAAAEATRQAMSQGAEVIYQGVLMDGRWRGRADFLVRVDGPSALGAWSYEAWDTKLARHARPSHLLQLAYYSERLAALQAFEPAWMHVVLGTDEHVRFRCAEFLAYFRAVRDRFAREAGEDRPVSPYPVAHCAVCDYAAHCDGRRHAEDHLTLVAGIRRSQVERLQESGVQTCADLAACCAVPAGIGPLALHRLRQQAALQTHFRRTGEHRYELLPPGDDNGFHLLPAPSPGDVFFDMEGYPFFEAAGGLEYLFGAVTAGGGEQRFHAFSATDRAAEKRAFEGFVDFVWARLQQWPGLHVYHYSHYEPTALKRLSALHATREHELDEFLRREVFVDLYQVVRRALRISHRSYSIKAVRHFFMPDAGRGAVTGGAQSVLEFQRWLDTGDPRILEAIERYNEEDCVSTLRLRDWLLERKHEAEALHGASIPFRSLPARRDAPVETEPDEHSELRGRLAAIGTRPASLLAHLLDYHRREAKPEWWAYFQRQKKSLDELLDDADAIAGLRPAADPPVPKAQSLVYTLEFPPQEFKLKADAAVEGPFGSGGAGTLEWVDAGRGRLGLRRGRKRSEEALPAAILAGGPVSDRAQREAIVRVAGAAIDGGSRYRAVFDVLAAASPRFSGARPAMVQTLDLEAQQRLVRSLDESYLFIQGPPGSGKTWTGARLIVSLLRAGKRVGVTAPSHRAIHNLLEEVEAAAASEAVVFAGLKKRSASDETAFDGRFIRSVESNEACEQSDVQLVAGTSWLFARAPLDGAFDYLFVDEAGQVSLADAAAVGTAARNLVLLGDPQQLPHVTQNTHPEGAGRSVLEHLLGEDPTVGSDRGIFLARSWRMHPDICAFVSTHAYEGRLRSAPGCERQEVASAGLSGAGLRFIAVDHRHNAQQSAEEAAAIASEVQRLLAGGSVVERGGTSRPLTPADILVVAPYNMQVRCIRDALPEGVEVGTVDKFQGREAPVVFFSMASSSGEDVPRGLDFLFNRNRFNVAVSRAKCLSVVVCSPRLLASRCRTVEQMRLVNALCRFAEAAAAPRRHAAEPA